MSKVSRLLAIPSALVGLLVGVPNLSAQTATESPAASTEANPLLLPELEEAQYYEEPVVEEPAAPTAASPTSPKVAAAAQPSAAALTPPTDSEMEIYSNLAGSSLNEADRAVLAGFSPASRIAAARLVGAVDKKIVDREWLVMPGKSRVETYLYNLSQDASKQLKKMNKKNPTGAEAAIAELYAQAPTDPTAIHTMEALAWDTLIKKYSLKINDNPAIKGDIADRCAQLSADHGIKTTGMAGGALGKLKSGKKAPATEAPKGTPAEEAPQAQPSPSTPDSDIDTL